jgi:hypothetical protein
LEYAATILQNGGEERMRYMQWPEKARVIFQSRFSGVVGSAGVQLRHVK